MYHHTFLRFFLLSRCKLSKSNVMEMNTAYPGYFSKNIKNIYNSITYSLSRKKWYVFVDRFIANEIDSYEFLPLMPIA